MSDENLSILLIDDDVDCRDFIAMALEMHGITATVAGTAEDGIKEIASGKTFKVILTDMNLPGMNGPEFIKHVRSTIGATPVILITGDTHLDTPETLTKFDAQGCVTKPLDDAELAGHIKRLAGTEA